MAEQTPPNSIEEQVAALVTMAKDQNFAELTGKLQEMLQGHKNQIWELSENVNYLYFGGVFALKAVRQQIIEHADIIDQQVDDLTGVYLQFKGQGDEDTASVKVIKLDDFYAPIRTVRPNEMLCKELIQLTKKFRDAEQSDSLSDNEWVQSLQDTSAGHPTLDLSQIQKVMHIILAKKFINRELPFIDAWLVQEIKTKDILHYFTTSFTLNIAKLFLAVMVHVSDTFMDPYNAHIVMTANNDKKGEALWAGIFQHSMVRRAFKDTLLDSPRENIKAQTEGLDSGDPASLTSASTAHGPFVRNGGDEEDVYMA